MSTQEKTTAKQGDKKSVAAADAAAKKEKTNAAELAQSKVLIVLRKIAESLQELKSSKNSNVKQHQQELKLSHYRTIPEAVSQSYNLLHQGAALVHSTATKYTLMGKLGATEQAKMSDDLLQGCQFLATGCISIHDDYTGCGQAARNYSRQAARAVVQTVIQLIESFVVHAAGETPAALQPVGDGSNNNNNKNNNVGAQKTGAVWQACDYILEKKMPIGNRNAMRRELFTYLKDCNETMQEFQEMIDAGAVIREEAEQAAQGDVDDDDEDWQAFLDGQQDQYTEQEMPVAVACLHLIKCSKNTLNLSMQACEAVGEQLATTDNDDDNSKKAKLTWISRLHDLAATVGNGMTDMGACMYPPLVQCDTNLLPQVQMQVGTIQETVDYVLEATTDTNGEETLELPAPVLELASKLQKGVQNRNREINDAVEVYQNES